MGGEGGRERKGGGFVMVLEIGLLLALESDSYVSN